MGIINNSFAVKIKLSVSYNIEYILFISKYWGHLQEVRTQNPRIEVLTEERKKG
jgi:hypothetical protein